MLISVLSLVLLAIPAFAVPPQYPRPRRSARSVQDQPVTWVTQFDSLPADTDVRLSWDGGDGHGWQVYFIPQWHKQLEYEPVDIVRNTTATSMIWHTPKLDAYPEGTSFIMGVNDGSKSVSGGWYDVTGLIPFGEPLEKPNHTQAKKGWTWPAFMPGSA